MVAAGPPTPHIGLRGPVGSVSASAATPDADSWIATDRPPGSSVAEVADAGQKAGHAASFAELEGLLALLSRRGGRCTSPASMRIRPSGTRFAATTDPRRLIPGGLHRDDTT